MKFLLLVVVINVHSFNLFNLQRAPSMENSPRFKLLQLYKNKSSENPIDLDFQTRSLHFNNSALVLFKDVFTSCSEWKGKDTFALENCKNSSATENAEKTFFLHG